MADGPTLRSRAKNLFGQMSGKRGHASPSKSVQSDGLPSTDSVSGSKSPSPPSADPGMPKRRRTDNPDGVEPPPIANSAELLAFEQRLQNYIERQFTALNVQLRNITLRQAEQEERIVRLEQLESRVENMEKEMAARAQSPPITNPMPVSPANTSALQERFEELQQELDEKARRLNNIIIMGLKEEETPSSSPETIPSNADKVTGTHTNVVLPDELARTLRIDPADIEDCKRLGKRRPASDNSSSLSNPRPLLLKFKTQPAKIAVMRNKNNLRSSKYSNIFVNDDLTNSERARRRSLVPVYKKLRQARVQCVLRRDKLLSEGKSLSLKEAEVLLSLVMVPNRESSNGEPGPNTRATPAPQSAN